MHAKEKFCDVYNKVINVHTFTFQLYDVSVVHKFYSVGRRGASLWNVFQVALPNRTVPETWILPFDFSYTQLIKFTSKDLA